jgi:hypothetical protein
MGCGIWRGRGEWTGRCGPLLVLLFPLHGVVQREEPSTVVTTGSVRGIGGATHVRFGWRWLMCPWVVQTLGQSRQDLVGDGGDRGFVGVGGGIHNNGGGIRACHRGRPS